MKLKAEIWYGAPTPGIMTYEAGERAKFEMIDFIEDKEAGLILLENPDGSTTVIHREMVSGYTISEVK